MSDRPTDLEGRRLHRVQRAIAAVAQLDEELSALRLARQIANAKLAARMLYVELKPFEELFAAVRAIDEAEKKRIRRRYRKN
jgi:hypothetical protein